MHCMHMLQGWGRRDGAADPIPQTSGDRVLWDAAQTVGSWMYAKVSVGSAHAAKQEGSKAQQSRTGCSVENSMRPYLCQPVGSCHVPAFHSSPYSVHAMHPKRAMKSQVKGYRGKGGGGFLPLFRRNVFLF